MPRNSDRYMTTILHVAQGAAAEAIRVGCALAGRDRAAGLILAWRIGAEIMDAIETEILADPVAALLFRQVRAEADAVVLARQAERTRG